MKALGDVKHRPQPCPMCEYMKSEDVPQDEVWGCSICGRIVYPVVAGYPVP